MLRAFVRCALSLSLLKRAEFQLDAELKPASEHLPYSHPGAPQNILLTGATGFLGVFLLQQLVRTTTAKVPLCASLY